ncbi:Uncharacterized protein HZ326_22074 [Fusarium oxysporum f. sp. albedinis]|nr:Uncharacterized protein HZ326_22074 [Fusarium oxysporum f. sp. albedinis]
MHFITILTLWAPIAMCALWNIQGTCGITNICVIDRARVDERKVSALLQALSALMSGNARYCLLSTYWSIIPISIS